MDTVCITVVLCWIFIYFYFILFSVDEAVLCRVDVGMNMVRYMVEDTTLKDLAYN